MVLYNFNVVLLLLHHRRWPHCDSCASSVHSTLDLSGLYPNHLFWPSLFPGPSQILLFVLCIKHQVSVDVCHLAPYDWSWPSQAPRERSFARKQDRYCDRRSYDRHRDKIENCPTFVEVFKNLWKQQKDKVVSAEGNDELYLSAKYRTHWATQRRTFINSLLVPRMTHRLTSSAYADREIEHAVYVSVCEEEMG